MALKDSAMLAKVLEGNINNLKTTGNAIMLASSESAAGEDEVSVDIEKCSACEQKIVDGKEQALFCEGICKQWVQRYCAAVLGSI